MLRESDNSRACLGSVSDRVMAFFPKVCTNNADFSTASPTGTDTSEHRTVIIREAENHHCKIRRSGRLEWKDPNVAVQPICSLLAATVETAL